MYIKVCDRCGKQTNNKPAFLTPTDEENGSLHINGQWFGNDITLCDECLKDFDNFRYNHKKFKIKWVEVND